MKHLTIVALAFLANAAIANGQPHTAQGSMAGEVTAHSVLLQTRLTAIPGPALDDNGDILGAAGVAYFEYSQQADFQDARRTDWLTANAENDFIVRAHVTNLQAGQRYHYRPVFGSSQQNAIAGHAAQFSTLPAATSDKPVSFIVGSCQNYEYFMHGKKGEPSSASPQDQQLGYPSYAAMRQLKPDFFVGTGDIVYYDHPKKTAAKTLPELRKKWHQQARFPRIVDFFATTATYWSKDDHDFRFNDSDLSKDKLPLPQTGIDVFREQLPIHRAGDHASPTYRTHRINRDLQIWLTEGRDFRSPNKMKDGPDKTLWGAEQKAWLQTTLKASDARWKILISPTPMVGPDDAYKKDNHVNLGGFRHEADDFFAWLKANNISDFLTICGDRHWQYHSIHPSGTEEFGCGALNDGNARHGVAPGSKKGTDPDGLIKQPWTYDEPTGGFLYLRTAVNDAGKPKLIIEHRDDLGTVMNKVVK